MDITPMSSRQAAVAERRCTHCGRIGTRAFTPVEVDPGLWQCASLRMCRKRSDAWARRCW